MHRFQQTSKRASVAQSTCQEMRGQFKPGTACSRMNALGGCTQGGGVGDPPISLVAWYYQSLGITTNTIMGMCQNQGERFVSPTQL